MFYFAIPHSCPARCLAAMLAAQPVFARSEEQRPADLDPVVVTASQAGSLPEAPYSVERVNERQIFERAYPSLPDALRDIPGVYVPRTAPGQSSPVIRGFTGFRNLLLIDGIRLNNSVFREGANQYWATVDPFLLESVDVVKSSSSVLFGSDAVGGTVLARSKSARAPEGTPEGAAFAWGEALHRWSSGDRSHQAHAEANLGRAERWGLRLGISPIEVGDIRAAGIGRQSHTGYNGLSFDGKLDAELSPQARLTLAYQQTDLNDVWRTHSTIHGVAYEGTTPGTDLERILDQRRQLAYAQLAISNPAKWLSRFHASLSWHRQGEWQDRLRASRRRDLSEFTVDTLGAWFEAQAEQTRFGVLTFGGSFYRDRVASAAYSFDADGRFRGSEIQGPVGDDATYDQIAAFLEDKIAAGPRVDLYLGVRYSRMTADIGRLEDPETGEARSFRGNWDNVAGNARVLWRPLGDERAQLFAGVSQAFRAPNLSDLSRLDSARSDERQVPALNLDPERYLTLEIGARASAGSAQVGISYYHTWIEDQITRTPTGAVVDGERVVTKRNAGNGHVQGIEARGQWEFARGWKVFGHFAWTDGQVEQYPDVGDRVAREPISRLMPFLGQLGLRWESQETLSFELIGTGAAKADRLNSGDRADTERFPPEGTPGWFTLDLRAVWRARENVVLTAAVENITNTEYRLHGSGSNQPGTSVTLGAQVTF